MKRRGEKIAALTAYDFPMAKLLDEAGVPLLLVGDSVGMVVLGYPDTTHVTMAEMEHHMRAAARILVGRHDFKAFRAKDGREKNSIRTIKYIKIEKNDKLVYIYMEANGFLYNMARSIAGTLVEVGRGKFNAGRVKEILSKRDRRLSGPTMPAKGLCMARVTY